MAEAGPGRIVIWRLAHGEAARLQITSGGSAPQHIHAIGNNDEQQHRNDEADPDGLPWQARPGPENVGQRHQRSQHDAYRNQDAHSISLDYPDCRARHEWTDRLLELHGVKGFVFRAFESNAGWASLVEHYTHQNPRADFEFTDGANDAWPLRIVDGDVDSIWQLGRMLDQPSSTRHWIAALDRRRLLPSRTIGVPDAAFARGRVMAFRDIKARVPVFMEVRLTAA